MNATTKTTLDLAKTLAKSGFHIPAIEIHTPDGRTWNIATVPAGRGRHLDGHWGPRPGALGGFRLFETDRDTDTPNEHDAIDGDTWADDELGPQERQPPDDLKPAKCGLRCLPETTNTPHAKEHDHDEAQDRQARTDRR